MRAWLERRWYGDGLWAVVLRPLSWLMAALVAVRRMLYRRGLLASWRAPVPVVVVGNIAVGGTGKTPLVLWLAEFLKTHGRHPGIISRGYGGRAERPMPVTAESDPAEVGDEPLLMAMRALCPVWIGRDRPAAARALLARHPECDVLLSDDGLQHYALQRDVEIVVIDAARGNGNGAMLPVGPLREPVSRLDTVDAIVVNGGLFSAWDNEFDMHLTGSLFQRLHHPAETAPAGHFADRRLHAVAGIGHPARFFDHLRALGLQVAEHAFPDHHRYQPGDLQIPGADAILMTEKDAVKCRAFAPDNAWILPVRANVSGALGELVIKNIENRNGRKTA